MNSDTPDPDRRLLPRFGTSLSATAAGTLNSLRGIKDTKRERPASVDFDQLVVEWHRRPTLETAVELTVSASLLGRIDEARAALELVVRRSDELAPSISAIARNALEGNSQPSAAINRILSFPDTPAVRMELATLKRRLRDDPRNAIAWMDKAHLQTTLGQVDAAKQAVAMAVSLAPNNRFVLRSASRFHVHAGSKEEGLIILRRSDALRSDPWIMSAEVALSTLLREAPKSFRQARALIDSDTLSPWHTSELNGAFGTLAIHDRSVGKPGQFFRKSLRQPTENAIAQAQWFANNHHAFHVSPTLLSSTSAYEAMALKAHSEHRWRDTILACKGWAAIDPASSRPLLLGTIVAEIALHDGLAALDFTWRWTTIDPANPTAWNNHTVALAYAGRIDEAREAFKRVNREDSDGYPDTVYLATQGLLEYRSGNHLLGRSLYLAAAESSRARRDPRLRTLALWHLLREEARLGTEGVEKIATELWAQVKDASVPELQTLHEEVKARAARASAQPRPAENKIAMEVPGLPEHLILTFTDKK